MKTIKIKKDIAMTNLNRVVISNELMGTNLVQSQDGTIHISADLFIRTDADADEIAAEDFISVKEKESSGTIEIEIEELDLDEDDYDLSHRSELTIAIPVQVQIEAATDNFYLTARAMQNEFNLTNENGPIRMEEISGNVDITNENGPVKLYKLTGDLTISQENGPVSADNLSGETLEIKSENGAVKLREAKYTHAGISNENGMVFYETLQVDNGTLSIQNENGHINLALSPLQGFSLEAKAELGQIKNNFMGAETTMFDTYNLEVGDKGLKIELTTENGMIKINSSDMLGDDFFRGKLDYIKELLKGNTEQGIAEARKIVSQLTTALEKLLTKVKEEDVKDKIRKALEYLKSWRIKMDDPELKESVKESFESISQEIGKSVQEALKGAQEAMKAAKEKYQEEIEPHLKREFGKGRDFFKQFKGFAVPPIPPVPPFHPWENPQKEAMQEKARMKILEMLEAGKITSDEAEKLLKAIH